MKNLLTMWNSRAASGALVAVLCTVVLCGTAIKGQARPTSAEFKLVESSIIAKQGQTERFDKGGRIFLTYTPDKIGDAITFSIRIPESGTYHVQTLTYKDGKEAIYRLEVNGNTTGDDKDFYLGNKWIHGEFEIEAGVYELTFRCTGQNPKSKGFGLKFDTFEIRPVSTK